MNQLTEQESREGWKLLWDGKTTNGWRGAKLSSFPEKGWSMKDGVLKVHKSGGAESSNGGDIVTTEKYKNFILKVDFNTAMVIVNGNHVEHWLNGVKLVEYERSTPMFNALVAYSKYKNWPDFGNLATGNILLQDHGDEVFFKNIKIKELE